LTGAPGIRRRHRLWRDRIQQRSTIWWNRARNEDQPTHLSGKALGDAGHDEPRHRVADYDDVAGVCRPNIVTHRLDAVGESN
jgi:hypothetical protein